jgi:hypothetical protein
MRKKPAARKDPLAGTLTPTPEDRAVDLAGALREAYAFVPLSAPASCGGAFRAAVRRAHDAEARLREVESALAELARALSGPGPGGAP